jgi:hypothetical protein
MNDGNLLPEMLRRECRSYLQYIRESFPWAQGTDEALRTKILALAEEENHAHGPLARAMQKRHITLPYLGAFSPSFTTSNFLAVSYLVPRLATTQRQAIVELERDLPLIHDAELRSQFEAYRDLKRAHLQELEDLAGPAKAA